MRRKCKINNGDCKPPEEGWVIWFISDEEGDACAIVEMEDGSLIQVCVGQVVMVSR